MRKETNQPTEAAIAAADEIVGRVIRTLARLTFTREERASIVISFAEIITRHTTPAPAVTLATADEGLRRLAETLVKAETLVETYMAKAEIKKFLDATPSVPAPQD